MTRAQVAGLLAVVLLAVFGVSPARAQTSEERKREVDQRLTQQHDDLHESSRELTLAIRALERIAVQLPAAEARLRTARARLTTARAAHAALVAEVRGAQAAVRSAERSTQKAQERLDATRDTITGMARAAYMRGNSGWIGVILESDTPQDFVARSMYLQSAMRAQNRALATVTTSRAVLAEKAASLEQRRAALSRRERAAVSALATIARLTEEAAAARASVLRQVAERGHARDLAARERAADAARYRQLQAESRALAAQIRREQSRGSGRVGRGGLLWPTDGEVTSTYGYRRHPIYGSRRFHAGIDIGAPTGQQIIAVKAGIVIHAGPQGGYGNLVVIDHGDGFATAYAHQSLLAVSDGERVRSGEVIGYVGSTGASTGPHLHYETRVNGDPVDPLQYY